MSEDVIGRLRELADELPESVKGYELLEQAGDRLLRRQETLSERWSEDLVLLRSQVRTLRILRRELWGVERLARRSRGGSGARRGAGLAAARTIRAPRVAGFERSAAAGARAYGRAFANRLGHSGTFLRTGQVAGRALTASAAATAAARAPGSFRARQRSWTAVGAATGATMGLAAGARAASATSAMFAGSLIVELKRSEPLILAAATITGQTFGAQAGAAATVAFAANFKPPSIDGGGILGAIGDLAGGAKDLVVGGAGKIADGASWIADNSGELPGALWDTAKFAGNLGGAATDVLVHKFGDLDAAARWLGYGRYMTRVLKGVPIAGNVIGAADFGWQLGKLVSGDGNWRQTFESGLGLVPGLNGAMAAKGVFDAVYEATEGRARGGVVSSGEITLVGERGPEIVQLPAGSNVVPAHRTRELLERAPNAPAGMRTRRDLYIHQVLDGREIARATVRNIDDDEQWGRG